MGYLSDLGLGRLRWDLLCPFPAQCDADRDSGDRIVADLDRILTDRIDPDAVDRDGRLPDGLVEVLRAGGLMHLSGDPRVSRYNVFRVVESAAHVSPSVAVLMAVANGLGASAYRSIVPGGALRDQLDAWVRAGVVSGTADTEPAGAGNRRRTTVALPADDGSGYLLYGEKVFIGNAPVADLLAVSATVREQEREQVRLFFVDTRSAGFEVGARHEYAGLRGSPNGSVRLNGVHVPRAHVFPADGEWRTQPGLGALTAYARMLIIAAPALALARDCVRWADRFAGRRRIDGLPLASYRHVAQMMRTSRAELFAMESIVEWTLLAGDRRDTSAEQGAAKNICSNLCWRIVDRTMSIFAAEGLESATSKAHRGADAVPLERAFRDARALRIAGGVDFQVDSWAGQALLDRHYAALAVDPRSRGRERDGAGPAADPRSRGRERDGAGPAADPRSRGRERDGAGPAADLVEGRGAGHLAFVARAARHLATRCGDLVRRWPRSEQLYSDQQRMVHLGALSRELMTIPLVVARAGSRAAAGDLTATDLMETYCAGGRERIAVLSSRLDRARLAGA